MNKQTQLITVDAAQYNVSEQYATEIESKFVGKFKELSEIGVDVKKCLDADMTRENAAQAGIVRRKIVNENSRCENS